MAELLDTRIRLLDRLTLHCAVSPTLLAFFVLSWLSSHASFGQVDLPGPKADAFHERCLLLTTKFKYKGVDFQSKTGLGCIISTPQGQRILAMPESMTKPVNFVEGNERISVTCSMLLATKFGNTDKVQDSLALFTERVEEFPIEVPPKGPLLESLMESEPRIFRALEEQGEVSFNAIPLSGVMKFFREQYNVPIVIDEKPLEEESVTPDEPVTIELPAVSFRSALNLILKPYDLTFVVENEVIRITSHEQAEKAGLDPINHWNPLGPELASERRIFDALKGQDEVCFNARPLHGVMQSFSQTYKIPIVIYEKALEEENLTPEEPITLELPSVSLRSALNLILEPLNLTYLIENEVLLITTKARALAEHPVPSFIANSKGIIAHGTRLGEMAGTEGSHVFHFTPTQRYGTLLEAQKADSSFGTMTTMTTDSSPRREYAAILGPLASSVDKTLGVAFVSLPGDFQGVPIPARVEAAGKRLIRIGQNWTEIPTDRVVLASVINGSMVTDQKGEPVGMLIDQKVVTLTELVQSFLAIDSKQLGYWGAETKNEAQKKDPIAKPADSILDGQLPALETAEIKEQIERVFSLKGEAKVLAQRSIHAELIKRFQLRKKHLEEKALSAQSTLDQLKQLSDRLNKRDAETMLKLLNQLDGNPTRSQDISEEDPFK